MKKLLCIIGIIFATTMSTTAFAEMFSFQSVLGVNDISDIQSAVIVGDNGKCADIEQEDLQQWLNVYWNFQGYEPVILPQSNNGYYYIKLWNKDKTKSYVVNANSVSETPSIIFIEFIIETDSLAQSDIKFSS